MEFEGLYALDMFRTVRVGGKIVDGGWIFRDTPAPTVDFTYDFMPVGGIAVHRQRRLRRTKHFVDLAAEVDQMVRETLADMACAGISWADAVLTGGSTDGQ